MVGALAACVLVLSPPSLGQKPAGFLAVPRSGKGAGVLVLHPWWGLNADTKAVCNRLAKEGFVAFAPDLFHGKVASTISGAEALIKGAKHDAVAKDVAAASKYLFDRTKKPIAVVGFSFGAFYALELSNVAPSQVRSVVVFYGTGHDDFSKSKAAYLGHFAEKDDFEPNAAVEGLSKALHKWKRTATIHVYPGTGHWFFEPSRKDAFNKVASDLAWRRTLAFLKVK
jgi:carboxymethylenebutenolidase